MSFAIGSKSSKNFKTFEKLRNLRKVEEDWIVRKVSWVQILVTALNFFFPFSFFSSLVRLVRSSMLRISHLESGNRLG